ncbi:MAG: carbohydrate-binding family 9-like protein [Isosphaeraceae bacterium]|nr:carbohydrate-binding family 9-like protein [Isosphaeraceae bacterium]
MQPRIVALAALFLAPAPADPEATREATCRRASVAPVVDGRLDDEAWKSATIIDVFPAFWAGTPSNGKTKARLLWDDQGLYFAGELTDLDVKAFGTKRNDTLWNGDVFELFFKPASDEKQYYEFQANPRSTTFELQLPGDSSPDRPSLGVRAKAVVHGTLDQSGDVDQGWTVEGMIPWSAFEPSGGKPKAGDVWTFAICRYDYGPGDAPPVLTSSAPLRRPSFHKTEDYGRLVFEAEKPKP